MGIFAERADAGMRALIGLPDGEQLALIDEPAAAAGSEDGAAVPAKRGRGRPKGAPNKDTAEMREYLAALGYRSGLIALAEIGGGGTIDEILDRVLYVQARTGCKIADALKFVGDMTKEFTSYQASKPSTPPAARDLGGVTIVQVTSAQVEAAGGNITTAVLIATGQQNQSLSDTRVIELDADELDTSHKD